MAKIRQILLFTVLIFGMSGCNAQQSQKNEVPTGAVKVKTGADLGEEYLPLLKKKKVGLVVNQTSMVNGMHLIDFLISKGITVQTIFAPEHGYRGAAGPGDHVSSETDAKTGIPVISLYGSNRKPAAVDLKGLEYVVFDIQDVGARFYTYISTLHYVMEACAEQQIPVIVLDRPNPNGFYVDGPVLDTAFRSFVGMDPIPVVHGLTVGEYALMANGEGWLHNKIKCKLQVIKMRNYTHHYEYTLPVKPSPNLPDMNAVYLYPSLCFFEGTKVSIGRGTDHPFQLMGYPGNKNGDYKFTPKEIPGVIKDPPHEDVECNGVLLVNEVGKIRENKKLHLEWLVDMYNSYPDKENFFIPFFDKLAGTDQLRKQIIEGKSAAEIRISWQSGIDKYKLMRAKYLLYPE